jgi:hypothetical protein
MKISKKVISELENLEESLWKKETRFDSTYMNNLLSHIFFEFGRSGKIHSREDILSVKIQEINIEFPL